jgi:hypothetical protein
VAHHGWGVIKRNPFASVASLIAIFVGIPGVVSASIYLSGAVEPVWIASHGWVREWGASIIEVQNTQSVAIDRFLRYRLQDDLDKAKADSAAKSSPIVQEKIKDLTNQITKTDARINAAEKAGPK